VACAEVDLVSARACSFSTIRHFSRVTPDSLAQFYAAHSATSSVQDLLNGLKKIGGASGKCSLDNQAIVMATCQGLLLLIPYRIRLSGRHPNNSSP